MNAARAVLSASTESIYCIVFFFSPAHAYTHALQYIMQASATQFARFSPEALEGNDSDTARPGKTTRLMDQAFNVRGRLKRQRPEPKQQASANQVSTAAGNAPGLDLRHPEI